MCIATDLDYLRCRREVIGPQEDLQKRALCSWGCRVALSTKLDSRGFSQRRLSGPLLIARHPTGDSGPGERHCPQNCTLAVFLGRAAWGLREIAGQPCVCVALVLQHGTKQNSRRFREGLFQGLWCLHRQHSLCSWGCGEAITTELDSRRFRRRVSGDLTKTSS